MATKKKARAERSTESPAYKALSKTMLHMHRIATIAYLGNNKDGKTHQRLNRLLSAEERCWDDQAAKKLESFLDEFESEFPEGAA